MRGISTLLFCNEHNLKIVAITNCLSLAGRPVAHSHYYTVEDEHGRIWRVMDSYGSFVGIINYWTKDVYPVNDGNLWSLTTKRAFRLKIDEIRRRWKTLDEIVKILTVA